MPHQGARLSPHLTSPLKAPHPNPLPQGARELFISTKAGILKIFKMCRTSNTGANSNVDE